MPFLSIAGTEYLVDADGSAEEAPHDRAVGGVELTSFSGRLLSSVQAFKGKWTYPLLEMSEATYAGLKASIGPGAAVPCELPDGMTRTCRVMITSAPYVRDGLGYLYAPRVELREV